LGPAAVGLRDGKCVMPGAAQGPGVFARQAAAGGRQSMGGPSGAG